MKYFKFATADPFLLFNLILEVFVHINFFRSAAKRPRFSIGIWLASWLQPYIQFTEILCTPLYEHVCVNIAYVICSSVHMCVATFCSSFQIIIVDGKYEYTHRTYIYSHTKETKTNVLAHA